MPTARQGCILRRPQDYHLWSDPFLDKGKGEGRGIGRERGREREKSETRTVLSALPDLS